jgi:hypothetical protein
MQSGFRCGVFPPILMSCAHGMTRTRQDSRLLPLAAGLKAAGRAGGSTALTTRARPRPRAVSNSERPDRPWAGAATVHCVGNTSARGVNSPHNQHPPAGPQHIRCTRTACGRVSRQLRPALAAKAQAPAFLAGGSRRRRRAVWVRLSYSYAVPDKSDFNLETECRLKRPLECDQALARRLGAQRPRAGDHTPGRETARRAPEITRPVERPHAGRWRSRAGPRDRAPAGR